jgi:lysophospholipase L1-like esterase
MAEKSKAVEADRKGNIYGVIACQGDSLTFGARDPDGLSYPLFLGRMLSEKHQQTWVGLNYGISGECWAEIARRNYQELQAIPEAKEVCLWGGTNDAWKGRPLEQALTACEAVLDQCKVLGRFVYLATLPGKKGFGAPVEPWSMNEQIKKLNEQYRKIAERRRLALVDLEALPQEFFCDGIHLTQGGNKWVAEKFLAAIEARR